MNYRMERKKNETPASPDRGRVPARPYEPPDTDPWTAAKQRYVQPVWDMMDTFKGAYDNLLNTLGGTVAKPRRR